MRMVQHIFFMKKYDGKILESDRMHENKHIFLMHFFCFKKKMGRPSPAKWASQRPTTAGLGREQSTPRNLKEKNKNTKHVNTLTWTVNVNSNLVRQPWREVHLLLPPGRGGRGGYPRGSRNRRQKGWSVAALQLSWLLLFFHHCCCSSELPLQLLEFTVSSPVMVGWC